MLYLVLSLRLWGGWWSCLISLPPLALKFVCETPTSVTKASLGRLLQGAGGESSLEHGAAGGYMFGVEKTGLRSQQKESWLSMHWKDSRELPGSAQPANQLHGSRLWKGEHDTSVFVACGSSRKRC